MREFSIDFLRRNHGEGSGFLRSYYNPHEVGVSLKKWASRGLSTTFSRNLNGGKFKNAFTSAWLIILQASV